MATVADLISKGLLKAGENLVWYRRSLNQTYGARVQADGTIVTEDGKIHKTPSGAAKHFSKKPIDGWNTWKVASTKASLADLRSQLPE
jgi:hypothetical protein